MPKRRLDIGKKNRARASGIFRGSSTDYRRDRTPLASVVEPQGQEQMALHAVACDLSGDYDEVRAAAIACATSGNDASDAPANVGPFVVGARLGFRAARNQTESARSRRRRGARGS